MSILPLQYPAVLQAPICIPILHSLSYTACSIEQSIFLSNPCILTLHLERDCAWVRTEKGYTHWCRLSHKVFHFSILFWRHINLIIENSTSPAVFSDSH